MYILILSRTLGGSWAQKLFCVPLFLIIGNSLHSASITFPEVQRTSSNSLIRKGRAYEDKGGIVKKNNSAALGKVLVPQQRILLVVVQLLSHAHLFAAPWTEAHQASLSFTISRVFPYSCPLSQWFYLTISSSATPFSFCLRSFSASGSSPMS